MRRARSVCAVVGCPELATSGNYCQAHQRQRGPRRPDNRPPASQRGYGAEWRKIREAFLAQNPLCVVCGGRATEVDHIIALADGGTNDLANLQALCKPDHSRKTIRTSHQRGFGNPKAAGREGGQNR